MPVAKSFAALVFTLAGIHVGGQRVLPVGHSPAWSPNGARLAFVTHGNLWIADADGTHQALLVRGADNPAWAPNGRRLAFTRQGWIWTVRADGLDRRRLARGADPAWSPHGDRIAFDRGGRTFSVRWIGGEPRLVAAGIQPAYAHDGTLALVRDGAIVVRGRVVATGEQPTWSPDGRRLAYVRGGKIYLGGRLLSRGTQPDWRPAQAVEELLPDLDQRPPADLTIAGEPGHWLLGFTSLVDNVGLGPLMVVGARSSGERYMTANEHVLLANGAWRTYPRMGRLVYTNAPPHHHWHLIRFDSFELRTPAGQVLVRDHKSGFCLADHWGIAPGNYVRRKRFLGDCEQYHPEATRVVEGTSLGFTDRYPAFFHGQNDNITGLPAGVYDLVHRTNPNMAVHELRYENDAASVRLRLGWRDGVPSVKVLRRCPATATC